MASVPLPHQFAVGEEVTSTNINTYYSGISFLQNPPSFKLVKTSTQSITSGSFQAASWDLASIDTYGGWTAGLPTRYTVQCPGTYWISGNIGWVPFTPTNILTEAYIAVGGSEFTETLGTNDSAIVSNDTTATWTGGTLLSLAIGNYVEMYVFQSLGSAHGIISGQLCGFWMHS
jgi:hypothetical protein